MDDKKMKTLDSFHLERDEYKEKIHQMIDEAKLEQLNNQKYKTINSKMTSEEFKKYEQLREKAKNLIEKAKEGQNDEKSIKNNNKIEEEHSLSNIDTSIFIPSLKINNNNKEKYFKSYRVKKVKDLPCLKKKLDSRLHDSWSFEEQDNNLDNYKKKKSKSSPIKSYYVNYELQDIENELERLNKEVNSLEIKVRNAIEKDSGKETEQFYLKKKYEVINKLNAAMRRQAQLTILENEKNLKNRYELLNQELQTLNTIEESQKTDAQIEKEKKLLEELVQIVNKRSELHVALDIEEQGISDDAYAMNAAECDIEETNLDDFYSFNQDNEEAKCILM